MKTDVSKFSEFRKYYLSEFEWFDGEEYITFNLVGIDLEKGEAQVAVTDRGKISIITYDLLTDKRGCIMKLTHANVKEIKRNSNSPLLRKKSKS